MGKIKRGILGGFSGKVANIIGGSWKGIAYMRSQPLSVANPNTPGQQTQRSAFAMAVLFASSMLSGYLKPLWDRWAEQMSGYNAWIQANIANCDASGFIDYSLVVMSRGSLTASQGLTMAAGGPPVEFDLNWVNNAGTGNAGATDEAYLMGFRDDGTEIGPQILPYVRSDAAGTIAFTSAPASGVRVHAYISFRKADGTIVSDSDTISFLVP